MAVAVDMIYRIFFRQDSHDLQDFAWVEIGRVDTPVHSGGYVEWPVPPPLSI
jgi:hypothetical protein